MDERMITLQNKGCDIKNALDRILGDEQLYLECIGELLESTGFWALERAGKNHQPEEIYTCAITLKGVLGNLGLTPMVRVLDEILTALNENALERIPERVERLLSLREQLSEIAGKDR